MLLIAGPHTHKTKGIRECLPENSVFIKLKKTRKTRDKWRLKKKHRDILLSSGRDKIPIVFWGVSESYINARFNSEYYDGYARYISGLGSIRHNLYMPIRPSIYSKSEFLLESTRHNLPVYCNHSLLYPGRLYAAHTLDYGHSGKGLIIGYKEDLPTDAITYSEYIADRDEYRVHVSKYNELTRILIGKKRKKRGEEPACWDIRNKANGWVYSYNGVQPSGDRLEAINRLVRNITLLRSDFIGALDVIWDKQEREARALEINSAPGVNHSKVKDFYRQAFEDIINA